MAPAASADGASPSSSSTTNHGGSSTGQGGGGGGGSGLAMLHKRELLGHGNEDHSPADSNTPSPPGGSSIPEDQRTKKRKTGPGSRGVANLTPEQLAKKRANDREAQRAIRERTKNQIENLEKKIRDLTSQKPYQELQAVIQAKEAVEAENADLRKRLSSIMSLIQPVMNGHQGTGEEAYASPVYTYPAPMLSGQAASGQHAAPNMNANASTPGSAASPGSNDAGWHNPGLQSGGSAGGNSNHASPIFSQAKAVVMTTTTAAGRPEQQQQQHRGSLDFGAGEQLKLDFLLDQGSAQRVTRMQTGVNGAQDSSAFKHLPMKHDWNGAATALASHRPGAMAQSSSSPADHSSSSSSNNTNNNNRPSSSRHHHHHHHHQQQQAHAAAGASSSWRDYPSPMTHCAPTCPLDNILLDFLKERRQRAQEGVPTQEIVGPRYPSVSSLLNPARAQFSHPLSKVFTDILATFPGICTLPERVAVLYVMFLVMRLQIAPTADNAALLPRWAHPGAAQLAASPPHPAWVDHLPWPEMRERIAATYVLRPREYLFENFFIPYTNSLSVNWPYEETDVLLESPGGDELIINPVFERHMRRLENWTLGEEFRAAFPHLDGSYNLKVGSGGGRRHGGK